MAFGGTLIEDISTANPSALEHRRRGLAATEPQHGVKVDPVSSVTNALGTDRLNVNTIHHQ